MLREAVEALHEAVASSRLLLSVPELGGAVDWSPDGTVFVTEGPEDSGVVDIRDAETGESVLSFPGHDIDVNDVAFSAGRVDAGHDRRRRRPPAVGSHHWRTSWRRSSSEPDRTIIEQSEEGTSLANPSGYRSGGLPSALTGRRWRRRG